jgi:hypothetical protein
MNTRRRIRSVTIEQLTDHIEYQLEMRGSRKWAMVAEWIWSEPSYEIPQGILKHLEGLREELRDVDEVHIDDIGIVLYADGNQDEH